jgi:hypothetical protein
MSGMQIFNAHRSLYWANMAATATLSPAETSASKT